MRDSDSTGGAASRSAHATDRFAGGRPCPICAGRHVVALHTQRLVLPEEFGLPDAFDVVACDLCGMVYSNMSLDPEGLTSYYRAETYAFGSKADRSGEKSDEALTLPVDVARLRGLVNNLERLVESRDARILDVGCGLGALLALLEDAGYTDVQGIDPSRSAVSAVKRSGRRAQVGTADEPPLDIGKFDVVIMSHVLEHIDRPRKAIQKLRAFLKPAAVVYAEVPDASRYAEFLKEPFVDFNIEHVNHFSMAHLNELFRSAGFAIAAMGRNDCELAENWPYPAIYGVWRMIDTPLENSSSAPRRVEYLRLKVTDYVNDSRDLLARFDEQIATKLGGRRRVAVRCLGHRAWTLLAGTMLRDLEVVAYIDSSPSKQRLTIRGTAVTAPEACLEAGIPIVVLAYNVEASIVREYAHSDPEREVITLGRSRPC